jgi:hypothetical protein
VISQRLVTRILNDVNNDPDQLPILQHAMMRTWDAWFSRDQHDCPIDFEDYEKTGTMKRALSLHADEVYDELTTPAAQQICEKMFKALTDTSADSRGVRRPRSIADLCILTGGAQPEIKKQVEIFRKQGRTFLMPKPDIPLTDETVVDISHESLMRIWERLSNWTEEEARSSNLYMRLANSAQLKEIGQRGLLKDPELGIALQWKEINKPTAKWAEGYHANFESTMAYLDESRIKDLEEKKTVAQKEAARKRLVIGIFGLLGLIVVASFIALISINKQKNRANQLLDQFYEEEYKRVSAQVKEIMVRADSLVVPYPDVSIKMKNRALVILEEFPKNERLKNYRDSLQKIIGKPIDKP